jgi:hypothetical protein
VTVPLVAPSRQIEREVDRVRGRWILYVGISHAVFAIAIVAAVLVALDARSETRSIANSAASQVDGLKKSVTKLTDLVQAVDRDARKASDARAGLAAGLPPYRCVVSSPVVVSEKNGINAVRLTGTIEVPGSQRIDTFPLACRFKNGDGTETVVIGHATIDLPLPQRTQAFTAVIPVPESVDASIAVVVPVFFEPAVYQRFWEAAHTR